MSRVVSVWLPTWPTDRLRKAGACPPEAPLVTRVHDGHRMVVAAADRAAQALGLRVGMPLAHAQAMAPRLTVAEADLEGDAAGLAALAAWCLRYAPRTAADAPDGLWIDATGCAHLFGGEAALLADLVGRIGSAGFVARAAIADTAGAAHATARYGGKAVTIMPPGGHGAMIADLPVSALRLDAAAADGLRRLGLERIGQLPAVPRGPLARRFGAGVLRRLDQALGQVAEPIEAVIPVDAIQHRLCFVEPLLTAEAFRTVIAELLREVCVHLEETALGVRRLDLLFERVDASVQTVTIGTARAVRGDRHLGRLLEEKLETVDPGLGVEAMRLVATRTEPLVYRQSAAALAADEEAADADIGALIDRLENRFGAERVFRMEPVESEVPERSVRPVPALPGVGRAWAERPPRPARLLEPPHRVDAISLLPDQPPVNFTWRRMRHRIRRADGPERIHGEWWRRDAEVRAVRDYWTVEDEDGRRFWLFRRGDGVSPDTGDLSWFLHGFF